VNSSSRGTFSGHPELRGFGSRVRMYRREPDTCQRQLKADPLAAVGSPGQFSRGRRQHP
jgi:hypothetical protein